MDQQHGFGFSLPRQTAEKMRYFILQIDFVMKT